MATERNPYEVDGGREGPKLELEMDDVSTADANITVDPETGEVEVDLSGMASEIELEIESGDTGFFDNLVHNSIPVMSTKKLFIPLDYK